MNYWQNDSYENLNNFYRLVFNKAIAWAMMCIDGSINSYHNFWWINLILCLHITGTLDICMKKFDDKNVSYVNWRQIFGLYI